ncbi:MAG: RidA family protein [Alphaproteobacteria bacterium]|nr:RidA family protein [Alphaproteobacteria bacterium]
MSLPEFFNPPTMAKPVGQYSHGGFVKAGSDMIFIAGQVGMRPDGTLPATIEEQADEAYANVVRLLAAKGMTPANLVKTNAFLAVGQPAMAVRAARVRHFGDAAPASTFIYVPQLIEPKYLIEVEGVAVR